MLQHAKANPYGHSFSGVVRKLPFFRTLRSDFAHSEAAWIFPKLHFRRSPRNLDCNVAVALASFRNLSGIRRSRQSRRYPKHSVDHDGLNSRFCTGRQARRRCTVQTNRVIPGSNSGRKIFRIMVNSFTLLVWSKRSTAPPNGPLLSRNNLSQSPIATHSRKIKRAERGQNDCSSQQWQRLPLLLTALSSHGCQQQNRGHKLPVSTINELVYM